MFVSRSPQEFISNYPVLCRQFLAMVLISFSAQSLPRPISKPQHRPSSLSRERASCVACFPSFVAAFASNAFKFIEGIRRKSAALYS
jgi:hypothetical protein